MELAKKHRSGYYGVKYVKVVGMRSKEVPQDEALYAGHKEVQYALDKNGKYVKELSSGWNAKTIANSQFWKDLLKLVKDAAEEVRNGTKSTLYYFMIINQMDVGLLSQYSGIPKWRVKRHLKAEKFKTLGDDIIRIYADLFQIKADQLNKLPENPDEPDCIARWAHIKADRNI